MWQSLPHTTCTGIVLYHVLTSTIFWSGNYHFLITSTIINPDNFLFLHETKCGYVSEASLWVPVRCFCKQEKYQFFSVEKLIVFGFNDTSTLVGHFVSSPREREKRDRRDSGGDEKEGKGRKRIRNEWRNKNIPPLLLPATRTGGLAQL